MDQGNNNSYVDFESLQKILGLNDMTLFMGYLKEIYKDLAERSEEDKKKGINKVTFYDYIKLPIFIGEKLFCALDKNQDNFLNSEEFIEGLLNLYMGDFDSTLEIIFRMLDFDKDGYINKEDIKVILSYLPLKADNSEIEYKFQMQSLSEIDEILENTFENNKKLNEAEFSKVIQNKKSDIYLQILCFLYQKKPFKDQNVRPLKASKRKITYTPKNKTLTPKISYNELSKKVFITPSKKSTFSPAEAFLASAQIKEAFLTPDSKKSFIDINTPQMSGMKGMIRMNNELIPNNNENKNIQNSKDYFQSPSQFLKKSTLEKKKLKKQNELDNFDMASNLIKNQQLNLNVDSDSSSDDDEEKKKKQSEKEKKEKKKEKKKEEKKGKKNLKEEQEKDEILYENWVCKISNSNKLLKYFLVVIGKDIFYYKTASKEELLGMHNLSGCYIKPNGDKLMNGVKLYCFQIIFPTKHRNFYVTSKQIAEDFIINIKKGMGYLNFFDYYEMLDDIGEGKFGLVKLGIHKNTNEKVAIKIIQKSSMKDNDAELVKTEIDIMKLCHHPNIVRLLDHFENAEYIFIVMEYLSGGSLSNFLKVNKFTLSEKKICEIIYQIASGLKYLHQYGIVHRDLKPDNIMLTETEDMNQIKIMDFGLSKIMGPNETVDDGFGTLCYVAPEVLLRIPYNKEIDIWSMGVIFYYMTCGILPFDDNSDNEEIIGKKIVFSECKFPKDKWALRDEGIIELIKMCLKKKIEQRITINEFLDSPLFKKYNLN